MSTHFIYLSLCLYRKKVVSLLWFVPAHTTFVVDLCLGPCCMFVNLMQFLYNITSSSTVTISQDLGPSLFQNVAKNGINVHVILNRCSYTQNQLLSLTFYFCRLCEGAEVLERILSRNPLYAGVQFNHTHHISGL